MKISRRIEIETHTEKLLFASTVVRICTGCGGPAQMLTINQAAAFAAVLSATINQLIKRGKVHSRLTADGRRLVCVPSLALAAGTNCREGGE